MAMWWAFISQNTTKSGGKDECMHAIDDLCFGAQRSDAFCAFSFCYVARFDCFLSQNPNVYCRWPLFWAVMRHFDIFLARKDRNLLYRRKAISRFCCRFDFISVTTVTMSIQGLMLSNYYLNIRIIAQVFISRTRSLKNTN